MDQMDEGREGPIERALVWAAWKLGIDTSGRDATEIIDVLAARARLGGDIGGVGPVPIASRAGAVTAVSLLGDGRAQVVVTCDGGVTASMEVDADAAGDLLSREVEVTMTRLPDGPAGLEELAAEKMREVRALEESKRPGAEGGADVCR